MSMRLLRDGKFILEESHDEREKPVRKSASGGVLDGEATRVRRKAAVVDPAVQDFPPEKASALPMLEMNASSLADTSNHLEGVETLQLDSIFEPDFSRACASLASLSDPPAASSSLVDVGASGAVASKSGTNLSTALVLSKKKSAEQPPDELEEKPKSWSEGAYKWYKKLQKMAGKLRGGVVNVGATIAALGLGPENCILKIIFILYRHEGEDDYPYIPVGCGDGFSAFLAGARQKAGLPILALFGIVASMLHAFSA